MDTKKGNAGTFFMPVSISLDGEGNHHKVEANVIMPTIKKLEELL